jgi:hypothetical protein
MKFVPMFQFLPDWDKEGLRLQITGRRVPEYVVCEGPFFWGGALITGTSLDLSILVRSVHHSDMAMY